MFIASYQQTAAHAKPIMARRAKLIALSRTWQTDHDRQVDARQAEIRSENALFPDPQRRSVRALMGRVAAWHDLSVEDITGYANQKRWAPSRFDVVAAIKLNFPDMSLPAIGRLVHRDHSTVAHALRKRGVSTSRERSNG